MSVSNPDDGSPAIALEVHHLTVAYRHSPVLWAVDFSVPLGSMAAIIGPNGAGKSTLLKAIMGLLPSQSGNISVLGGTIDSRRSAIAYVPQKEEVDWDFPITVEEVVVMGRAAHLPFYRRATENDRQVARAALQRMGMSEFAQRQIRELSGGQQQRVFLARALTQDAQLYLLDEPLSGIDASSEQVIVKLLHELRAAGRTILAVHHDLSTVRNYFNWVVMLNMRLIAAGATDQVFTEERIQQTYSGRLRTLDAVAEKMRQKELA